MALNPRPVGSVNRHPELSATIADYSTRVSHFLRARRQLSAEPRSTARRGAKERRCAVARRKYSAGLVGRFERTCRSLIPLIAIVSLLVGIVCLKFAMSPTINGQARLAGTDVPSQGMITFGEAMPQLGPRH
jgi:hypothetical protein